MCKTKIHQRYAILVIIVINIHIKNSHRFIPNFTEIKSLRFAYYIVPCFEVDKIHQLKVFK